MFLKRKVENKIEKLIKEKKHSQATLYTLSLKEKLDGYDKYLKTHHEGRITKIDAQLEVLNTLAEAL